MLRSKFRCENFDLPVPSRHGLPVHFLARNRSNGQRLLRKVCLRRSGHKGRRYSYGVTHLLEQYGRLGDDDVELMEEKDWAFIRRWAAPGQHGPWRIGGRDGRSPLRRPKENCNPRSIESQLTASIDKAERPWLNIIALLMTVVMTLVQHEEAIRCIQEHLLGVPIQEELTALRNRVEIFEVKNASLRDTIRTIEAVETSTCNHERLARIEIERQLASVQESYHQDQEDDDNK
nr:hypothetical protein [Tanacetum cinerariifolium]